MDASFGVTMDATLDVTRIDRRSPTPGNKHSAQHISLVKIGKRNGMLDSVNPDLL